MKEEEREVYDFIVDTLIKTRINNRGWAASQSPPPCIDEHTLSCVYLLCKSSIENREDIYRFKETCNVITSHILQLMGDKESLESKPVNPAPCAMSDAPEPTRWADDEALIAGPVDGHPVHEEDEQDEQDERTYYYTFHQNNSGGCWDLEYHHVIIEAPSADVANNIAEKNGVYFDSSLDCDCCGPRWWRVDKYDASDAPEIYSDSVDVDLQADVDTHTGTHRGNPYIIHRYKA